MTSTTKRYRELCDEQAPLHKCFFAFSKTQFERGMAEAGIGDNEKIYQDNYGLYGTKEGLEAVFTFYEEKSKRIAEECNPQAAKICDVSKSTVQRVKKRFQI